MAIIEVENLTKRYDFRRSRGIQDMSFSVEEGEIFGFIGPNGAGKSTTIRILMNFIRADSGFAGIAGYDCGKQSSKIKRITGYMPSNVNFYSDVRVSALLNYACYLKGIRKNTWVDLAEKLSLDPNKRFRELSMGNRRKLSLIQAIMSKPRLLILDEPTDGLDPIMRRMLFAELKNAQKDGATIFFSSHNLSEVQEFCDRVALVKEGHVEMMPDLKTQPVYTVEIDTDAQCAELLQAVQAQDIHLDGSRIRFTMPLMQMDRFLEAASRMGLRDISIGKPSLEERFRQIYYGEAKDQ